MSDLVERLRRGAAIYPDRSHPAGIRQAEAADRIEALENALRHIATAPLEVGSSSMYPSPAHWLRGIAKRALEAK